MSKADEIFITRCKQILDEGELQLGHRAKWSDGTFANTLHITNIVNEYDVAKEFPIGTLRKTNLTSVAKEILWIFQKKSNKVSELGLHIWDQWQDENGTIGKAYGYQIAQRYLHHKMKSDVILENQDWDLYPSKEFHIKDNNTEVYLDQMDGVLWDLRNNPTSRRIMTNTYCFYDLAEMGLYPCAYSTTWNVTHGKLNLLLNQRSQDMLAASFWNVAEYAALLIMVAKATGLEVGRLTHVISDCHIYDKHIPIIQEIIQRTPFDAPEVSFTNQSNDFYAYTPDDFAIDNYQFGPQVKFEVAE